MTDVTAINDLVLKFNDLKKEIGKVIIGQEQAVTYVLLSVICGGHSLLVGVPGLAKTLLVKTVSDALGLDFKRIQFTPDLMPSDILGSEILNKERDFTFIKGPIFSNIILADEINRTPPKTQAALLEAMQEKTVTMSGHLYKLELPFLVLATQNPIEQEGTYPLPEAQLDRFMFSINLEYPSFEEEVEVVKSTTTNSVPEASSILSSTDILDIQHLIRKVPVADNVIEYAVALVGKTRPKSEQATDLVKKFVDWGAGPRASQNLILAAKANAAVKGKYSPDIEDVKAVAIPILSHRIVKNYKAEAEDISVSDIIKSLL
tara:strand:+ start:1276 stop:2229 length:954 start_codon:yes stop_codon:yes gene_type:complete